MHTMLLFLGIMYEMVVQDQSHLRLMEEAIKNVMVKSSMSNNCLSLKKIV
jgi:hypothetical protein